MCCAKARNEAGRNTAKEKQDEIELLGEKYATESLKNVNWEKINYCAAEKKECGKKRSKITEWRKYILLCIL
jgi:hypothetical protein